MKPALSVDTARAETQRAKLAIQAKRAFAEATGKLPATLQGLHDAVEAEIVADNYGEAESLLEDLTEIVDEHLRKLAMGRQREAELEGTVEQVEVRRRAKGLETGGLAKVASDFYAAKLDYRAALNAGNLGRADELWKTITGYRTQLLAMPEDDSADGLKKLYEDRLASTKKKLDYWVPFAGSTDVLLTSHQPTLGTLKAQVDEADTSYNQAKYKEAIESLDKAIAIIPGLSDAVKAQDTSLGKAMAAYSLKVFGALKAGTVPPTAVTTLDAQALQTAYKGRTTAQNNGDYVKALRDVTAYGPDFAIIWQAMQNQPQAPVVPTVSPKAAEYRQLIATPDRKALTAALNAPDADLVAFRAQPGATKLLDDMVKAIGTKADSKEKRDFIQAAMKARFGLKEVSGGDDGKGMSTKALPRMYKLFGMLPPEHTTENEMITSVERLKVSDTSLHSSDKKKIVLKAGKTGSEGGTFDDTTLHEIAHGVDSKFHFMENNGGARKFGGWRAETKDSVKKVASDSLKFHSYFEAKNVDRTLLEKYLELAISGSNPKTLQAQFATAKNARVADPAELKKHPAVAHALAKQKDAKDDDDKRDLTIAARKLIKDKEPLKSMLSTIVEAIAFGKSDTDAIKQLLDSLMFAGQVPADDVWAEMAVHPAIDFASNVGLKNGSSGLWDQGDSAASRYAVNGRVYQQAYPNEWVSYLVAARGSKVCNYQFRHRMEWFAECYSRFFLGTLAPNHPLVPWLAEQKNAAPKGA
ncbi:MAG TPA: hypothetical protein VL336_08220 [Sphingomicrobium sp.]|nr:hypothetical protein [Sphingomicrobium sp.]